ncbi:MaoC family dehydratase [Rhodococcus opacus]|uniref:MaoC family dehydratase n=1 Tax=Rhodococcus opacus TaxID=37919 RepID=UPI0022361924|nr:MaoC family dehydratase N-terminal domain-containing protein [Rhodococcus opacus]UZG60215.1 MaoC family dehydratase N-terminal domain-containing protein [Rhodococcus opacus]
MTEILITDDDLAWVGRELEFVSDVVTESQVRQFVAATDDYHPAYDGESADELGIEHIAPPMLYYGITRPWVGLDGYADDGTVLHQRPLVGTGQAMGGTLSVEWIRPLHVGDRLRGVRTLASLEEKQGSRMRFALAVWNTEYRDQNGELVIREQYEQILF